MLSLFLVQANGDAFSEVVFKPLENPPFGVFWGLELLQVFIIIILLTEYHLTSSEHYIYALPCVLLSVLAYRLVLSVSSVVHQA